jgi:hypothetical protein
MRFSNVLSAALLGAAAVGLSGCATGFPAQVSRYQAMPAPAGQTFFVVPMDARLNGSLQFQQFGGYVAQALAAQGYTPATSPQDASLIVNVGYGVDHGQVRYVSDPFDYGYGGFGGFGGGYGGGFYGSFHRPFYSRWGGYGGFRSPFFYGWDDPFWYGGGVNSYVEYRSNLDLDIRRKADNQSVFEGHAQARSESNNLNRLVPNLVEAMFTGFPGRNGENVRITVPPPGRVPPATARAY